MDNSTDLFLFFPICFIAAGIIRLLGNYCGPDNNLICDPAENYIILLLGLIFLIIYFILYLIERRNEWWD